MEKVLVLFEVGAFRDRHEKAKRSIDRFNEELSGFAGDRENSNTAAQEEEKKAEGLAAELERLRDSLQELDADVSSVRVRHDELAGELKKIEEFLGVPPEKIGLTSEAPGPGFYPVGDTDLIAAARQRAG